VPKGRQVESEAEAERLFQNSSKLCNVVNLFLLENSKHDKKGKPCSGFLANLSLGYWEDLEELLNEDFFLA